MMTKETKVGLLAGMALILLIGILVSDHLSESREDTTEELVDFAGSSQESVAPLGGTPAVGPIAPIAPSPDAVITIGGDQGTTSPVTPTGIAMIDAGRSPIVPLPEEMLFNDARQARVSPPGAAGMSLVPEISAAEAGNLPVNPDGLAQRRESTMVELFKETPRLSANRVDVRKKYHTVKAGESLYVIAKKQYGDGEKWTMIRDQNEGKVSRNGAVREGVRLVIPPMEEPAAAVEVADAAEDRVHGSPATGVSTGAESLFDEAEAPAEPVRRTAATTRSGKTVVTVKAGQTLGEIAQQYLGSSRRWPEILEANRKQLRRPEELQAGMKLVIPSGDASEEAAPAPRRSGVVRTASTPRSSVYRVREGDTLSSIARERMGSRQKWDDLYRANKSRIEDPDVLVVGTELTLP